MTPSAETFDRSVVMSSLMPSLKYSCSASPLMLAKGSTQTETRSALGPSPPPPAVARSGKRSDAR